LPGRHGGEQVDRLAADSGGVTDLDEPAVVEHGDHVGERFDVGAVVRRHQRRDPVAGLEHRHLGAHAAPQLVVERGERLVEQQHGRHPHERPGDLHHLLLAHRQRRRIAFHQRLDVECPHLRVDALADLLGLHAPHVERERHVATSRQMSDERRRLEHHADLPFARLQSGDVAAAEPDAAAFDRVEAGDGAQQRCLAAAGTSDDRDQRPVADRHRHIAPTGWCRRCGR
jgi:hypothetical protein